MSEPQSKADGCLIRGCLFFAIVILMFMGFAGWGAYSLYKHAYALTSDGPVPVPIYEGSGYPAIRQRVDEFQESINAGRPSTLSLSAEDMNALVALDPAYAGARGHLYFDIQGSDLIMQVSIPLNQVRWMENRWLNGKVTIEPKIEGGHLTLIPKAVKAGDHEAPMEVIKSFQAFPWGERLESIPEIANVLRNIKSLKIQDERMVIETR